MGVMEEILAELRVISAALSNGGTVGDEPSKEAKPKGRPPKAKGPNLEQVQTRIKELVAADEGNTSHIKAAIVELGGKRAGDFEDDPAKLAKLMEALESIGAEEPDADEDDGDLL